MAVATGTAATVQSGEHDHGLIARAVVRAQNGEMEALGFLYARYADDVNRYVRSILADAHDADDVTQQVFAKLITSIGKYEPREVPFLAWVLRVSRNLALDHIRARRCVPVEEVRVESSAGPAAGATHLRELREALAQLPADQREVLVMRHLGGLSPGEIATRTGRTEGSVHGLHHRGRRALQVELRSRGVGPATRVARAAPGDPSSAVHA
jgi:RNA polymerase sigma-70 factor (ECF subfamily)